MAASVFPVVIAPPIVKWALMLDLMLRKAKILYGHRALVAEFARQYVPEVY